MDKIPTPIAMNRLRMNREAGVSLFDIQMWEKVTGYRIYDYQHHEIMEFEADEYDKAVETFEQMITRKP